MIPSDPNSVPIAVSGDTNLNLNNSAGGIPVIFIPKISPARIPGIFSQIALSFARSGISNFMLIPHISVNSNTTMQSKNARAIVSGLVFSTLFLLKIVCNNFIQDTNPGENTVFINVKMGAM